MVGAGGLGGVVLEGISRVDVGAGFEGGIAVVILAIYLDRLTGALGHGPGMLRALFARGRNGRGSARRDETAADPEPTRPSWPAPSKGAAGRRTRSPYPLCTSTKGRECASSSRVWPSRPCRWRWR